jgi:hypothetical protein
MRNSLLVLSVVFVTVFIAVPAHLHGLEAPPQAPDPHHPEHGVAAAPSATTPESCQHMTRMMSEMNAADAKLDELVQAMNAAKGPEKADAIAAVVTALVKEQAAMRGSMAMMMKMMSMMDKMDKLGKMSAMGDMATGKPKP